MWEFCDTLFIKGSPPFRERSLVARSNWAAKMCEKQFSANLTDHPNGLSLFSDIGDTCARCCSGIHFDASWTYLCPRSAHSTITSNSDTTCCARADPFFADRYRHIVVAVALVVEGNDHLAVIIVIGNIPHVDLIVSNSLFGDSVGSAVFSADIQQSVEALI